MVPVRVATICRMFGKSGREREWERANCWRMAPNCQCKLSIACSTDICCTEGASGPLWAGARCGNADLGPPTITGCGAAVDGLQIVRLAHHAIVEQRKLLAGGQLAAARVARKARQMEDQVAGATHPIGWGNAAAAFRALGTEVPVLVGWLEGMTQLRVSDVL